MATKLLFMLAISLCLTPIVGFLEKYMFSDWEFVRFLVILVAGDTFLGFVKAWRNHKVHSKGFAQIFFKLIAYMSVLILTHVLTHYKVNDNPANIFLWFDDMAYAAMIVRESISILENIGAIYPRAVPVWLLKRLKEFDLKGKFKTDNEGGEIS